MKTLFPTAALTVTTCFSVTAQVGIGTASPHPSAAVDISSSTKGLLPPRMTWGQIQAISSPAAGLLVYDVSINAYRMFNGKAWVVLAAKEKGLSDAPGTFGTTDAFAFTGGAENIAIMDCEAGPASSVYVGGIIRGGTLTMGSFSFTNNDGSFYRTFLARLDSSGAVQWMGGISSASSNTVADLAVDASGAVYLCGDFSGTADFDISPSSTQSQSAVAGTDSWFAKYSAAGTFQWARTAGGAGSLGTDRSTAIATDGTSVFVAGNFSNTLVIGAATYTNSGDPDGYLMKASASTGATAWSVSHSGPGTINPRALAASGGGVVLCGRYYGTMTVAGTSSSQPVTAAGSYDAFVAAYTGTGGLQFVHSIGNGGGDGFEDLDVDPQGNIYLCGTFAFTVDFDPSPTASFSLSSYGNTNDAFVMVLNNVGGLIMTAQFGGTGIDGANTVRLDGNGSFVLGGSAGAGATFGSLPVECRGESDAFLIKGSTANPYDVKWAHSAGSRYGDYTLALAVGPSSKRIWLSAYMAYNTPYIGFDGQRTEGGFYHLANYIE